MKLVFPIASLLACVILFLYLPLFGNYCDVVAMDMQQYQLDKAVELSTRAAAVNGLQHGLVTFDKSELQEVEFNGSVVLDTYAQFMCFNYDMLPTEENKETMLNRTAMMVIGGRGYSVTQNEYGDYYMNGKGNLARIKGAENPAESPYKVAANTGTRTLLGVYTPFIIKDDNPNVGTERYISGSILPNVKTYGVLVKNKATGQLGVTNSQVLPGSVTPSRIQHEAVAQMSRAFTQAWNQLNRNVSVQEKLTLPETLTNFGVSSVANPGVMVLVEGFNLATTKTLRSQAFTGYKAVVRREIVAYTQIENGHCFHWYCYRDQLDMDKVLDGIPPYNNITVDYVYPDMQSAAKAEIMNCAYHGLEQKYTCEDEYGNPTLPHCHYQPNMAMLMK